MQTRSIVCQEFARHLDVGRRKRLSEPFFSKGDKMAYTTLKVVGTPSKQGRPQAHDWLASRGIVWEGDARTLRKELRKALDEGDAPENYFGLRIERTVEICGPERAPRRLSPYYNGQAAAFADKSDPDYFEF
jgi:hypothetical protein